MVIVVNTRLLISNRLEGIGWFTFETLKRITLSNPQHRFVFLFDRQYDPQFIFAPNVTPVVVGPPTRHPLLWYFWFEWRIPAVLKRLKADVFVSTDGYLSLRSPVPQLTVMHDINFVHRPADLPWLYSRYYNYFFRRFAKKADQLVTVSHFSADDIATTFNIPSNRIDVVPNGCSPDIAPLSIREVESVRAQYSGGNPYFLYVGALHPRKNIHGLLKAFELFRSSGNRNEKLIVAGGAMFKTKAISKYLAGMRFRDEVIFTGRLSSGDLHRVLGAATALTFVPFFEGFGVPILEAMTAGVPVICSNTTSLPEVAGEAALYVNPDRTEEIADAMLTVSISPELRLSMIQKGFSEAKRYSWDDSARKLWQSILSVQSRKEGVDEITMQTHG